MPSLPHKRWRVEIADGPHLEGCLNDLDRDSYEVYGIYPVGAKTVANPITGGETLNPFLMIVARLHMKLAAVTDA